MALKGRCIVRLAVLFCLSAGLSFAGTWSGTLVDARCWGFEERNIPPNDTTQFVDRDRNEEVRFCSPGAKTKTFAIVPPDGMSLALDGAGNAKAAGLIRGASKYAVIRVSVTGDLANQTIQVRSIARTD